MTNVNPRHEYRPTSDLDVYEELRSGDPEPPIGTLIEDAVGGKWYRLPEGDWLAGSAQTPIAMRGMTT